MRASLGELLSTPRGRATVACDFLALIGMALFLVIEASLKSGSRGVAAGLFGVRSCRGRGGRAGSCRGGGRACGVCARS